RSAGQPRLLRRRRSALVRHRRPQPRRGRPRARHRRRQRHSSVGPVLEESGGIPLAARLPAHDHSQSLAARVRGAVIRKVAIAAAMAWTLVVTMLRAARLPNKFSTEHWLIDYRFGFVKRGLVGSVLSVVTGLAGTPPSERLIDALAIAMFVIFCAALLYVALLVVRRSRWSTDMALAALVFLSSPFVVMSAHLIGYYDNIVILLTLLSLALLFRRRVWAGAAVQAVAILVHE